MPFDLITTVPIGLVLALAAKQLYTMITDWLNRPVIVANVVLESVINNTVAIRNNIADVAMFISAGALETLNNAKELILHIVGGGLEIINNAKELILHIVGGAIQEVIRVLHLVIHIVKQGLIAVKNIYHILIGSLQTFYVALKTVNDAFWYVVEGTELVVTTVVTAPGRMFDYANKTVTVFVEDQVLPTIDWILYGPKISYTRYYILLAVLILGFSAWNYYGNYKKKKQSTNREKTE